MHTNQRLSKKYRWRTINPGSDLWTNVEVSRFQRLRERMRELMRFRKTAPYRTKDPDSGAAKQAKKKKRPFLLPHWTVYDCLDMCVYDSLRADILDVYCG